ncbi:RHTO0S04e09912g1_1 [Rhodotorula toruloides]|uniref:RHTO0S04e09912g1_1 n=1 Tax=Rhodotorula toruloides TaxID=5286 RepID=A0A061AYJ5_RHOTO|nr:RHTO0S04e09912g1_1 [Rhodotorula toruloides]
MRQKQSQPKHKTAIRPPGGSTGGKKRPAGKSVKSLKAPKAPPLPSGHCRAQGDPQVPEDHRAPHSQAPLPAPLPRDLRQLRADDALASFGASSPPGGGRRLPRRPLRRHEPLRNPCQAYHHPAKGHATRPPPSWRPDALGRRQHASLDPLFSLSACSASLPHSHDLRLSSLLPSAL